jgi:hypothetical protein
MMNLNNLYLVLYIKVKIMYDQKVKNIILNDEFLLNQLLMLNKIEENYSNDHYKIHHHIMIMM